MSQDQALVVSDSQSVPAQVQTLQAKERESMLSQIGSGIRLSTKQTKTLRKQADRELVDILPSGEIYVPGNYWRQVLNDAFTPMGWGVRAGKPTLDVHEEGDRAKSVMYREVFLIVSRCAKCLKSLHVCDCASSAFQSFEPICVNTAMGAQEYHPNNARMTYDDAAEACVTNGLMRCCKLFGVFENIWDKRWAEAVKHEIGIMVKCDEGWGGRSTIKIRWRRYDAKPLRGELGLAAESPNGEKYEQPQQEPKTPPGQIAKPRKQTPSANSQTAEPPVVKGDAKGEKILVCRQVKFQKDGATAFYWVVNTDVDEYFTEDEQLVRALEVCKSAGRRIVVSHELKQGKRGMRKIIIEFKAL